MQRRNRNRDERGVTIVLFALTLTSMLLAAAFAVDLGWWYVRAAQTQRAADAAALAGVVWMPGDLATATRVARQTAKANGFEHGVNSINVDVRPGLTATQLDVDITDSNVPRFFSAVAFNGPVSIERNAIAEYKTAALMGAPMNQLGGWSRRSDTMSLAIGGFCNGVDGGELTGDGQYNRDDTSRYGSVGGGDRISSGYVNQPGGTSQRSCPMPYASASPSGNTQKNPDYDPNGYYYTVRLAPARSGDACAVSTPPADCSRTGAKVTIETHSPWVSSGDSANYDRDNTDVPTGCGARPRVRTGVLTPTDPRGDGARLYFPGPPPQWMEQTNNFPARTIFSVYQPDATPLDPTDNPLFSGPLSWGEAEYEFDGDYVAGSTDPWSSDPNGYDWKDLAIIPAGSPAGDYLVNVRTPQEACSAFFNVFGLRARVGDNWARCFNLPGYEYTWSYYGMCPVIAARKAMTIEVVGSVLTSTCDTPQPQIYCGEFYLIEVSSAHSGRTLKVKLTDLDDDQGLRAVRIYAPDANAAEGAHGAPLPFTYKTIDGLFPAISGSASAGSGLPTAGGALGGRTVELSVQLPTGLMSSGGLWTKIGFEIDGRRSVSSQIVTIEAEVDDGVPTIHLVD